MLPPVLEIYIVHHPDDEYGPVVAQEVFDHFHGTSFRGLIGGAAEVYVRTEPWGDGDAAPRPIPVPSDTPPTGVSPAQRIAVVPVISLALDRAAQHDGAWRKYLDRVVQAQVDDSARVGVFPVSVGYEPGPASRLSTILGPYQRIAVPSGLDEPEPPAELRCRDLAQGITQMIRGETTRLQVFISHTRRAGVDEEETVRALIREVREIIRDTRLQEFFDANDLQQGRRWEPELRRQAAHSALLALRTDLYASRAWCQREMMIAKNAGMPIVILDALGQGEERGSFLMDHVPRIPVRQTDGVWRKADIRRGLNHLVDECLKRALWEIQQTLAGHRTDLNIAWWAPHAPEPVTLLHWLHDRAAGGEPALADGDLRVLHPDPPLGPDELEALKEMVALMGHYGALDVMTPRALAARGA